jgi:hypothetical protein
VKDQARGRNEIAGDLKEQPPVGVEIVRLRVEIAGDVKAIARDLNEQGRDLNE